MPSGPTFTIEQSTPAGGVAADWFTGLAAVEVEHVPEVTSQTVNTFTMLAIDGTFTLPALVYLYDASQDIIAAGYYTDYGYCSTQRANPDPTCTIQLCQEACAAAAACGAFTHYNDDSQCYFYNEGATQLPAGAGDLARRFYIKPDPAYTTTVITPSSTIKYLRIGATPSNLAFYNYGRETPATSTTDDVGGHVPLVTEEYWDNSYAGWPVRFGECSDVLASDAMAKTSVAAAVAACLVLPSTDCAAIYRSPTGQYYPRGPAAFTSGTECTGYAGVSGAPNYQYVRPPDSALQYSWLNVEHTFAGGINGEGKAWSDANLPSPTSFPTAGEDYSIEIEFKCSGRTDYSGYVFSSGLYLHGNRGFDFKIYGGVDQPEWYFWMDHGEGHTYSVAYLKRNTGSTPYGTNPHTNAYWDWDADVCNDQFHDTLVFDRSVTDAVMASSWWPRNTIAVALRIGLIAVVRTTTATRRLARGTVFHFPPTCLTEEPPTSHPT